MIFNGLTLHMFSAKKFFGHFRLKAPWVVLQRYSTFSFFLLSLNSCANFASYLNDQIVVPYLGPSPSAIPLRPSGSPTGKEFLAATNDLEIEYREVRILQEILRGNIPTFLRSTIAVEISAQTPDGTKLNGTVYVMPDYLAIGSNDDFVRIPMNPITAQQIADHFGYSLPTTKIVDAVFAQAELRLDPKPLRPGSKMISNYYYKVHNELIEKQLKEEDYGKLLAGHKKDVVLSNRLNRRPTRVAIYGWHQEKNNPIQPLSTIHGNLYADYSHGIRLIKNMMFVEGKLMPISEVLTHPIYSWLINKDGIVAKTRISVDCRR